MKIFRVVDLETTDEVPPSGEIIEIGRCDLSLDQVERESTILNPHSALYLPPNGNRYEAKSVHHITDEELAGKPVCDVNHIRDFLLIDGRPPDFLVAHNAKFEQQWLTPDVCREIPWICTFKVARHVFPLLPKTNNSYLRYYLEREGYFDPLDERSMPPHRAGPDAYVTAHILSALLQHATIEEMLDWTLQPTLITICNFGKNRGKRLSEILYDDLHWVVFKSQFDEETKWNFRREMDSRGAQRR